MSSKNFSNIIFFFLLLFSTNVFSSDIDTLTDGKKIQELRIKITDSRKWSKNILNIYKNFEKEDVINSKFKKNHNAKIEIIYNDKSKSELEAKVRSVGLNIFHFSKKNFITSLEVKLKNGNINNITKFRLLLPESRLKDNEIFNTTLFNKVGLITPRTFYIKAKINNVEQKFIFQETLSKELIERNKFREGPIYIHSNNHRNELVLKVENSNWIKNDIEKFKISLKGLENLHYAYSVGFDTDLNTNYAKNLFRNFDIYEGMMLITNSFHGLGIANRAIYFDPILNQYHPIYNDGKSRILEEKKIDDNNFINQLNQRSRYFIDIKKIKYLIDDINIDEFYKELNSNGLNLSKVKIQETFNLLKKRLTYINDNKLINNDQINSIKQNTKQNKHLVKIKDEKYLDIFSCNKENNCKKTETIGIYENKTPLKKLLSQDYNEKNIPLIGTKDNFISKKNIDYLNYKIKVENFYIHSNEKSLIKIDKINKEIFLVQKKQTDKFLINGEKIENWKIFFKGNLANNINFINTNSLTGCLTFYEINIINLNIRANNGICEDIVNIVRSNGNIIEYNSEGARSDSLDIDYSDIVIHKMIIDKSINDCADFSYGKYFIEEANIKNCGDKAVSVGEKSFIKINNLSASNSNVGLASKDSSIVKIKKSFFNDVETCLSAYNKKQEFTGGLIEIEKNECTNFSNLINVDKFSKIIIK